MDAPAGPRFPGEKGEGAPIPKGMPTNYSAKFPGTVHENKENLSGGRRPKFYYVDPPLGCRMMSGLHLKYCNDVGLRDKISIVWFVSHCCLYNHSKLSRTISNGSISASKRMSV